MIKTLGWRLLLANILALVHYSVVFLGPQVLKKLIDHIEDPEDHAWKGYFFSVTLFLIYFTSTLFFQTYVVHMYSVAISVSFMLYSQTSMKIMKTSIFRRQDQW